METALSPHALHRCVRSAGSGFNCRGPATSPPKIIRAAAAPHSLKYSSPLFVFLIPRFVRSLGIFRSPDYGSVDFVQLIGQRIMPCDREFGRTRSWFID